MTYKYRFSLCVACYNSAKFIDRVFKSIDNFTFRNFELLIINDASSDNTDQLIQEYISRASFSVKYLNREKNEGLQANVDWAIDNAEGELFLGMGHDDEWLPETLTIFDDIMNKYDKDDINGIGCLCVHQDGKLVGYKYPKDVYIANYFNVHFERGKRRHEIPYMFKTKILSELKSKGESYDLLDMGCYYNTIYINCILRVYYINENPLALTKRSRSQIAEKQYLTNAKYVNVYQYQIKSLYLQRLRMIFSFPYYGCIAGKKLKGMLSLIDKKINKVFVCFLYFPAFLLSKVKY